MRNDPGGDWERKVKRAVKSRSSLFLSLISKATEANPDRFVHDERRWAAEVHVPGEIFYIPVIIDDTEVPQREPEAFAKLHRYHLPGGKPTPAFIAKLLGYLKQYNGSGEVRDD